MEYGKCGVSEWCQKREREEASPPGPWEFYAQGTWHASTKEQSAAFDVKIEKGLCVAEESGHAKKKKTDRRIRRKREKLEFVLVPAKHWPKPAKCTCCNDGVPARVGAGGGD
jgi:hypothetical protein